MSRTKRKSFFINSHKALPWKADDRQEFRAMPTFSGQLGDELINWIPFRGEE